MSADVDNKEIVEGPATGKDKIVICAVHMKEIVKDLENSETVISNHVVRTIFSTELDKGITIPAISSGKEKPQGYAR